MKITDYTKENLLLLDGSMGTMLQAEGLAPGELPERWNISHSETIINIHKQYFDAGSNVVLTNTFGANRLKFSPEELRDVISAAVANAREASRRCEGSHPRWIALDIGPSGRLPAPYGDLLFEEAVELFAQTVRIGAECGADLIFIETMNDSYETKAALLAAKENCDLPVFVSNAFGEDGKLMTGASPAAMVALLEGMGADAIGVNCSLGPKALGAVVEEYLKYSSVPVLLKPNAGLPRVENGRTVYDLGADEFADECARLASLGVRCLGGCCGTSPEYIRALRERTEGIALPSLEKKDITLVSSYTHAVRLGERPVLIGERINPTGKKRFKEALRAGDVDYILKEGIDQDEHGAHILDVNVGIPEIDEKEMLTRCVKELQAVSALPLQLDTSDVGAMESALRIYNGKAMINSVNGKRESMEAIFPLAKKYGGVVVCLTLDESGIPESAEGRLEIARRIVSVAESYGIDRKDLIFDPLALTVSADGNAANETLRALYLIKSELGCNTSLGISNVSFGLPRRELINSTFFTLALSQGLSAAIMNPYSSHMMSAYYSFCALCGKDESCLDYIAFAQALPDEARTSSISAPNDSPQDFGSELERAISKGLKERAAAITAELLKTEQPLSIVENEIIPALNSVGVGFENKTVYLPQLLMSAEAAKAAFEEIKAVMSAEQSGGRGVVVLATVKGDIHDIGKNIVKLLLENYGFGVCDLGRDVSPEDIAKEAVKRKASLVGLSALMTTTVPSMEATIKLLRKEAPWCRIVVGGAVLTQDYADMIGADKYAPDAMATVRYAEEIFGIEK